MNSEVLRVKDLCKSIKRRKIIYDMNFAVEQGDICGFIGPNGAGKTTIMRLMTGLIKPTSGDIYINNINVLENRKQAMENIGAMVESPIFFPYMTGEKMLLNLAKLNPNMNKKQQKSKVKEVLKIVDLEKRAKDKISTYSLGMKQRLGIAQALLNNPKIVFLDEPANGLDPMGMVELRELILKLNSEKGITFFISSHLLDELQKMCNKLIIIRKGKLVWSGGTTNLLNKVEEKGRLEDVFVSLMRK